MGLSWTILLHSFQLNSTNSALVGKKKWSYDVFGRAWLLKKVVIFFFCSGWKTSGSGCLIKKMDKKDEI